jgi:cation diffusion facilitator family transporter
MIRVARRTAARRRAAGPSAEAEGAGRACCEIRAAAPGQRRVLVAVLGINAVMFVAEFGVGLLAHSTALIADSVDMLGDALVYGFSLYAVGRGPLWSARAALLKGVIMVAFGLVVLVEAGTKLARGAVPAPEVMGGMGVAALAANAAVLLLLWRRRGDDLNMRSAWLCSRNDVAANAGVLLAAAAVAITGAAWPDIAVGLAIAVLFVASATGVIGQARRELRAAPAR